MKKKNNNKNFVKLVVFSLLVILITTSANSAMVKTQEKTTDDGTSPPYGPLLDENYYEWIDEFDNEQKIDIAKSWGYEVSGGKAKMKNTFSVWDDPDWTRMKPISVSNSGSQISNCAINFEVDYDSDMQSDYDDIRFKHEDAPTNFLNYWIESSDLSSASVWVKVPSLPSGSSEMYLFYGNPNADSESYYYDVFTDWDDAYANDEQITYHSNNEGAWDSDVCFGNNYFLVAWEEGQAYWPLTGSFGFKQEIRASMYGPDGGDPVVFDKLVYKDSATFYRNENPSIAYGNGKFFVAFDHYQPSNWPPHNPDASTMDIYARTVQKSGNGLTLGDTIVVCDEDDCQADAKVVYDSVNERFLVVWEDAREGTSDYHIWAKLYDADNFDELEDVAICDDSNSQCEPWAAFDPINEQYFIVWEEGLTANHGPFKIMGGIFDKDLDEIWTGTIAEPADYPNDDIDYNFPCVSFNEETERYLVTWNDGDISDDDWYGNVWGKIYDASGNVKVSQFTIKNGNFVRTDIVPYLTESFFISFDNTQNVYGKLVSADGSGIGSDVQLSASPSADADWASMATNGQKIFVAWEDLRINYPPPYNNVYPDIFGNIFNLNIPDGSDISYTFGQEKELILEAQITSDPIAPANLESWHDFQVEFDNTISFDILDGTATTILIEDADNGEDLSQIDPEEHQSICLQAHFTRTDASYTPTLDWWMVRYVGRDDDPPITSVDWIDGILGKNDWYISESVTVWLKAIDLPPDTGSGIDKTYYTINGGSPEIYNEGSGIFISSYEPDWLVNSLVNFWSVDNSGNVEDNTKPENYRTIKIDAKPPEVVITSPEEEEEVRVKFWVYADASDNAGLEKVEFDIEPFGQRPDLPFVDEVPPYKWECDQWPINNLPLNVDPKDPQPLAVMVQIRAHAFDVSGQEWIHQVFVNILNWNARPRMIVIPNFKLMLESLKLGLVFDNKLDIEITGVEDADTVEFAAIKIFTKQQITIMDNDFSDGISASFDIPTGLYKIVTTSYKEGEEIARELISRVFFIRR